VLTSILCPGSTVFIDANARSAAETTPIERLRNVARDGADTDQAFVALPFDDGFDDVFVTDCRTRCANAGCYVSARSTGFTGDILARLKGQIQRARLVVDHRDAFG
jgi:hypothetical protein